LTIIGGAESHELGGFIAAAIMPMSTIIVCTPCFFAL
jgi:hypothetical protein